ncbi:MAG: hypothetical protein ACREKN_09525 [Longimicrobiaceae bacterium]
MASKWFQTWDRPEYLEWAAETPEGYALVILREEPDGYFCARAELTMGERGLPEVEPVEEKRVSSREEAEKLAGEWTS